MNKKQKCYLPKIIIIMPSHFKNLESNILLDLYHIFDCFLPRIHSEYYLNKTINRLIYCRIFSASFCLFYHRLQQSNDLTYLYLSASCTKSDEKETDLILWWFEGELNFWRIDPLDVVQKFKAWLIVGFNCVLQFKAGLWIFLIC